MTDPPPTPQEAPFFARAECYDVGIHWDARLAREVPVLIDALGAPGAGGLLDAGCGPGHHAVALVERGYRVTGLDGDAEMLALAERHARCAGVALRLVHGRYAELRRVVAGGFDGAYCLGNALAASGDRASCREALTNLGAVLRPGGRLFVQVVNFRWMRAQSPCVRGPRVATRGATEYVSVRHFTFDEAVCRVTNVTTWKEGETWRMSARAGRLYPIEEDEVRAWCAEGGLEIEGVYGGYQRETFDAACSRDLIFLARRIGR